MIGLLQCEVVVALKCEVSNGLIIEMQGGSGLIIEMRGV